MCWHLPAATPPGPVLLVEWASQTELKSPGFRPRRALWNTARPPSRHLGALGELHDGPALARGGGDSGLLLLWQVGGVGLQGNAEQPPPGRAHGSRRQARCEASSWCLQACRGWGSVSPCGQPDLEKAVPATWP